MKSNILKKFPKFLRLSSKNKIEFSWGLEDNIQKEIEESIENRPESLEDNIKKGMFELYQVPGSTKRLIIYNNEASTFEANQIDIDSLFPIEELANYAATPQATIDLIAEWVKESVQFERFDLIRINHSLRRFHFEYSIGLDIEEVIHTAYSEISNSGLGGIFNEEKPYLVEDFKPEVFRFKEDPLLYQTGFRSVLRVPIMFNKGIIGAIMLASVDPERYQVEDAYLLENIGKAISRAFFHAGILQEKEYQTLAASTMLQAIASRVEIAGGIDFIKTYCQMLRQFAKLDRVCLYIIDYTEKKYRCIAEAGKRLPGFNEWVPIRNRAFLEMLNRKSIVAFNLADFAPDEVDQLLGHGFTTILYSPILDSKGNIRACLGTAASDESAMSKEMAGLFKVASEQLAYILNNSGTELGDWKEIKDIVETKPKGFEEIIGSSKSMQNTIEKAAAASHYEFPILLSGETGTGKELFAKAIHRSSSVANGPFIVVNSAAIPENLLESELFGYKEGVFTGGLKGGKKGKIQLAHGGTLFLDEIGELSLELQAKLLRVIQEKEVEPLGAERPIPVEVRFISATHRNLNEMVTNREFREDLYYRLNSIELKIPPLRERGNDIIELAESMFEGLAKRNGKRVKKLSNEAKQALMDFDWPGNVRQLQNVINWIFVFADDDVIKITDLPPEIRIHSEEKVGESEAEKMAKLLTEFDGNKTALANYLGITRTGLWKKLKRLGLQ